MEDMKANDPKRLFPAALGDLYQRSVSHRVAHGCGGYSFEDGSGLFDLVRQLKPSRVLELGTALGYTSAIFASSAPESHVDTVEADRVHVDLARKNLEQLGLSPQVTVHQGDFETVLAELHRAYDLAFFDGYAPTESIVQKIEARLTQGGHLICANLGLAAPKALQGLRATLSDPKKWQSIGALERGATLVIRKIG